MKRAKEREQRQLVYRQKLTTRVTHWVWAISVFFLLLSGLQIFNAHPSLYLGDQSGFAFDNAVLEIGAEERDGALVGTTELFGVQFETTGVLGVSDDTARAFPAWATIPSGRSLAFGRVVHFFFAWILVATLLAWLVTSALNGHLRELVPSGRDIRSLPRDIRDHLRLRFHHGRRYSVLQKLTYAAVLFGLLPLLVVTGLAMSPGINAAFPWLTEVLGGRQTARTLHFAAMLALVGFFVVHMAMIVLAGPINEMRSIITGWYRADAEKETIHD